MTATPDGFAEIDSCQSLFLLEIGEPRQNSLRLLIEEAFVGREEVSVKVGGTEIAGCHPVEPTEKSRFFEIIWDNYVAYSVTNESYSTRDEFGEFSGRFARVYSKSHFLEYISHATLARNEYPGPLQHIGLVCECHIVDVVATQYPRITKVEPKHQANLPSTGAFIR